MSLVASVIPSQRFMMHQVTWSQYENFLAAAGDRKLRHTYCEGTLEIMSPARDHEWIRCLLSSFVSAVCRVTRTPRMSIGSMTMCSPDWEKGMEADEGFYIGSESVAASRTWTTFDPLQHQPAELFVEVDISSSSDHRMKFYAQMGVPEVWRFRKDQVEILELTEANDYRTAEQSNLFPVVSTATLNKYLALRNEFDDTEIEIQFEACLRGRPMTE